MKFLVLNKILKNNLDNQIGMIMLTICISNESTNTPNRILSNNQFSI